MTLSPTVPLTLSAYSHFLWQYIPFHQQFYVSQYLYYQEPFRNLVLVASVWGTMGAMRLMRASDEWLILDCVTFINRKFEKMLANLLLAHQ